MSMLNKAVNIVKCVSSFCFFFSFNDTATTEIYTLSLHDALPISLPPRSGRATASSASRTRPAIFARPRMPLRSEEHTSELQSHHDLVCRLLLEKKKKKSTLYSPLLYHSC